MLRKKKSFQMETGAQHKALSDIDYSSNYDEIFENNGPELDGQTPNIDELDIHSSSESFSETDYGNGNNKFFQDNALVNGIGCRGPVNRNSSAYQSDKSSSMADFDMLRSSPPLSPGGRDHFYLTSAVN